MELANAATDFGAQAVSEFSPHGWALVIIGFGSFFLTWSITLLGAMKWLNSRFDGQREERQEQFKIVNEKFDKLPSQFQETRHTLYGAMGQAKTELKEMLQDAEKRIEQNLSEVKQDIRDLRGRDEAIERRVTQLEMLRIAALKENGARK